jgi:surface polysaccharide O-acyltransferase-like enzyme
LLLSRQDEGIGDFYKKRFLKVGVPLLAWSVIYMVWEHDYSSYSSLNAVKAIIYAIVTNPVNFHLWFLYELFAIYLVVPIFRVFVRSAKPAHLWYFAGIWFAFGPLAELVDHFSGVKLAVDLGFLNGYLGYFVFGYILGRMEFNRRARLVAALAFSLSALFTILATYRLAVDEEKFVQYFYHYLRLNVVFMSLSAFVLLKAYADARNEIGSARFVAWCARFARASFGIYLIHALTMVYLRRGIFGVTLTALSGPAVLMTPLTVVVTVLVSWLIVAFLQRIPFVRGIVPR